eukprot:6190887-Pleurochrysis_carterae.AAC.3
MSLCRSLASAAGVGCALGNGVVDGAAIDGIGSVVGGGSVIGCGRAPVSWFLGRRNGVSVCRCVAMTRARRNLRSGRSAECCRDVHPVSAFEPPAVCIWVVCWQRRFATVCNEGANPGLTSTIVFFCVVAPRAHCANAIDDADVSSFKARMSGVIQSCAWRLWRNIGDDSAPRSAGCPRMYSAPAVWAVFNRLDVHRTTSFACSNSRR